MFSVIFRKKNILKLFVLLSLFSISFEIANAQGLVPCGGHDQDKCTLCHLVIGFFLIITWLRNILAGIALAAITFAGVMYIVSAGNQEMMERAKNMIKQAIIGAVIVLGAWLIVDTVMLLIGTQEDFGLGIRAWNKFECK